MSFHQPEQNRESGIRAPSSKGILFGWIRTPLTSYAKAWVLTKIVLDTGGSPAFYAVTVTINEYLIAG